MEQSNKKLIDTYLIYAGRRNNNSIHVYYIINDISENDKHTLAKTLEKFVVKKRLFKRGSIGAIYQVKLTDDRESVNYSPIQSPVDYWNTKSDTLEWQTLESAAKIAEQVDKKGKENALINTLQPIKKAYKFANNNERAAILAEVIKIITS